MIERPHVVILGAGCSKAAAPQGDANGVNLPVMDDFLEVIDGTGQPTGAAAGTILVKSLQFQLVILLWWVHIARDPTSNTPNTQSTESFQYVFQPA